MLTGLQVNLTSKINGDLQLPSVGSRVEEWSSTKFDFSNGNELEMISILTHPKRGVCDVILTQDSEPRSLANDPYNCKANIDQVEIQTLNLTADAPLVGFHGKVDKFGIVSLGPILLDTLDPICQQPYKKLDMKMYKGMDDYEKSEATEATITEDERVSKTILKAPKV